MLPDGHCKPMIELLQLNMMTMHEALYFVLEWKVCIITDSNKIKNELQPIEVEIFDAMTLINILLLSLMHICYYTPSLLVEDETTVSLDIYT